MFALAGEPGARPCGRGHGDERGDDAGPRLAQPRGAARPKRLYNVKTIAELQALAPSFDFKAYLARGERRPSPPST
jgi:hypothetical protein